jgi:hypothetical protein
VTSLLALEAFPFFHQSDTLRGDRVELLGRLVDVVVVVMLAATVPPLVRARF